MARFEVIQHELEGGNTPLSAEKLYYLRRAGVTLKQIRITLEDDEITTEQGALHFMHGRIEARAKAPSVGGLLKSQLTGETIIRPTYKGRGVVYLEPTFSHVVLYELESAAIVVDKGIYYASASGVKVDIEIIKSISGAVLGGEGLFQTKLTGAGTVALVSPVPEKELQKVTLKDEKLSVDGNFAILRSGNLSFRVERSTKGLFGSAISGDGLLQTFEGTGTVWLAPFKSVYDELAHGGIAAVVAGNKKDG
jgi:uncharacterized protein (AIM24 family)